MDSYVFAGAGQWIAAAEGARTHGLYRLSPGTEEWGPLTAGLPEAVEVQTIVLHPDDPATLYAGTHVGPYKSTDAGDSWAALPLGPPEVVWSILIHPADPRILLVGAEGTSIHRSDDAGTTWRRLPVVAPQGRCNIGIPTRVIRLAVDPADPDELYAAFEVGGVARSPDGGRTWVDCNAGLLAFAERDRYKSRDLSDSDNEGIMDSHALAFSAARPGAPYLATRMGLFQSDDRGATWQDMDIGLHSPLTYARDIQVSPHDPSVMFGAFSVAASGDAGSLYRSEDLGATWSRWDHGVDIASTVMKIALSPRNPQRAYAAARRGQILGTEDGGETWREHPLPANVQGVYALACT